MVLGTGGTVSGDVVESGARVVSEISTRGRVSTGGDFWGRAGDVQERHTELLLPGDERVGAADRRRRNRDSGLDLCRRYRRWPAGDGDKGGGYWRGDQPRLGGGS